MDTAHMTRVADTVIARQDVGDVNGVVVLFAEDCTFMMPSLPSPSAGATHCATREGVAQGRDQHRVGCDRRTSPRVRLELAGAGWPRAFPCYQECRRSSSTTTPHPGTSRTSSIRTGSRDERELEPAAHPAVARARCHARPELLEKRGSILDSRPGSSSVCQLDGRQTADRHRQGEEGPAPFGGVGDEARPEHQRRDGEGANILHRAVRRVPMRGDDQAEDGSRAGGDGIARQLEPVARRWEAEPPGPSTRSRGAAIGRGRAVARRRSPSGLSATRLSPRTCHPHRSAHSATVDFPVPVGPSTRMQPSSIANVAAWSTCRSRSASAWATGTRDPAQRNSEIERVAVNDDPVRRHTCDEPETGCAPVRGRVVHVQPRTVRLLTSSSRARCRSRSEPPGSAGGGGQRSAHDRRHRFRPSEVGGPDPRRDSREVDYLTGPNRRRRDDHATSHTARRSRRVSRDRANNHRGRRVDIRRASGRSSRPSEPTPGATAVTLPMSCSSRAGGSECVCVSPCST